jgi:hypothetical protein
MPNFWKRKKWDDGSIFLLKAAVAWNDIEEKITCSSAVLFSEEIITIN